MDVKTGLKNQTKLNSNKNLSWILVSVVLLLGLHNYSRLFSEHQSKIQTATQCYYICIFCSYVVLKDFLVQVQVLVLETIILVLNSYHVIILVLIAFANKNFCS